MALIKQYRAFVEGLAGYTEITFEEFRTRIAPLRTKKAWTTAETQFARDLAGRGGAFSLQRLCGKDHPAAAEILGAEPLKPEETSLPEIRERLVRFGESTRRRDAAPLWYAGALATIRSSEYKLDFTDDEEVFPGLGTFAGEYRGAGRLYRREVDAALTRLGAEAAACGPRAGEWATMVLEGLAAMEDKETPLGVALMKFPQHKWNTTFLEFYRLRDMKYFELFATCIREIGALLATMVAPSAATDAKMDAGMGATAGASAAPQAPSAARRRKNARKARLRAANAQAPSGDAPLAPAPAAPLPPWAEQACALLGALP